VKKALIVIVILLLIVAGGIYYFVSNIDAIVEAAIEKYGSEVTQTAVRVDRVKIDLKEGAGGIFGLTVANPAGFKAKQAFSLGETSIKIDLKSLRDEVIVIDAVTVRAPKVNYEMNAAREGSLNKLYDNIAKSLPAGDKGAKADEGPKLIVRKLVVEGGAIDARVVPLDNKQYTVNLPAIRMANLGAPRGATASQLAKEILARVTREAQDEVKRQLIDKRLKGALETERKKLEGQAQGRLEEEKKKAEERLQDLLKR
jgi:hypothetical protein